MEEAVRFELTDPLGPPVFETGAISQTLPRLHCRQAYHIWSGYEDSNPGQQVGSLPLYPLSYTRLETSAGIEPAYADLQSAALPLGHLALFGTLGWSRTTNIQFLRLAPLPIGLRALGVWCPRHGFEPAT